VLVTDVIEHGFGQIVSPDALVWIERSSQEGDK
jgi:hypothetical protein